MEAHRLPDARGHELVVRRAGGAVRRTFDGARSEVLAE
jgi:hypothetical protein